MSRSIYWKMTIPIVLLVLFALGALGAYITVSSRSTQIDQLESELTNEARLVADDTASAFADPSHAGLSREARTLGADIGARITLISPDGTVLGDTDQDPSTMENHSSRPEVVAALATGVGRAIRYSATLHENMMYVAVPVRPQGTVVGISRVALPLTQVERSVDRTVVSIIVAVGIAAILVIVATFLIAGTITRPVRRITRAAEAIASGRLDQEIPVRSQDEIGRLGSAFNAMSVSVKASMWDVAREKGRLSDILSSLTDGVLMTDSSGALVFANPAAESLLGFSESSAEGKPFIEAVHDHDIDAAVTRCLRSSSQQQVQTDSLQGRFLRVIAVPLNVGGEKSAVVIVQDLTELRTLQTVRREFVGNVSHELRTPLAGIKAIVDTLRDGAMNDAAVAGDFLNRLDSEVDRMTQMINELIELSRIETGSIRLNLGPVDINEVARDVLQRLGPQADRKHVTLKASLSEGLPSLAADRQRVEQVITNIVHNAVKFTPSGRISLEAHEEGRRGFAFSIADTGIGIAPDEMPHVFTPFTQLKANVSRPIPGTGLGLPLSKALVELHGGSLIIDSTVGAGTTVTVTLPANRIVRPQPAPVSADPA